MLDRSRFENVLPADKVEGTKVYLVGLGNLGTALGCGLARLGVKKFIIVDPDTVEEANVATQGYDTQYLGWDKVEAMRSMLRRIEPDAKVVTHLKKIEDCVLLPLGPRNITVAALDSLEARKATYEKLGVHSALYVDPRMALEDLEVTFLRYGPRGGVDPKIREYVGALDDTDTLDLPCSAKSIAYTGQAMTGLVLPQVRRWLLGVTIPYVIHAHLGRGVTSVLWRAGEGYTEEKFS